MDLLFLQRLLSRLKIRKLYLLFTIILGYSGAGTGAGGCSDIDECTTDTHNCADEADCTNTAGSFTCACKTGYNGDGYQCSGKLYYFKNNIRLNAKTTAK